MRSRTIRIGVFVVQPTVLASLVALRVDQARLHAAVSVLVALWVVAAGAIAMRVVEARRQRARDEAPSPLEHVDLLTASGAATLALGLAALLASTVAGWASLSVIGVLGLGTVYLAVAWVAIAAGGDEPWRRATITRAILPEVATESAPIREEISIRDVMIPAGTRLFVMGRVTPHAPITRYVVSSDGSLAEVALASELGPAPRGEHQAPPLALWLGDVLGLARTAVVHRAPVAFTVLPRLAPVDGARALLGKGGDDQTASPTVILPTEGTFRTREYVPGDDTRRIHWVRSVNTNKLVVRLPDEVPAAEPTVRLVLDTELAGTGGLATRAPDELLDALVRVWLGVGKALAEDGIRVVLVTACRGGGDAPATKLVERAYVPRAREPLRLGARVTWQTEVPLTAMLGKDAKIRELVVSCRPRSLGDRTPSWIVVPERAWTLPEPSLPVAAPIALAFPTGSADNRAGRRREHRRRILAMHQDRAYFSQEMCTIDWPVASGGVVARPQADRVGLVVIR